MVDVGSSDAWWGCDGRIEPRPRLRSRTARSPRRRPPWMTDEQSSSHGHIRRLQGCITKAVGVGQVAAGWSGWLEVGVAVYRPQLSVLAPIHIDDPQLGRGGRAALARCCVALDGRRVGQVPAHLGDEEVPLVAAYVGGPRGNEPNVFVTSVPVHAIPGRRRAIPDQWWTSVLFGHAISVMKCALNLDEPGSKSG